MASEAKRVKKDLNEILIEELKCYICKSGVKVGKHRWYRCPQPWPTIVMTTGAQTQLSDNFTQLYPFFSTKK